MSCHKAIEVITGRAYCFHDCICILRISQTVHHVPKYMSCHKAISKEHTAMEELAKRKDLIITNTNEGGAEVVMETDSYIKVGNR